MDDQLKDYIDEQFACLEERLCDYFDTLHPPQHTPQPPCTPHPQARTLSEQMFGKDGHLMTNEERKAVVAARSRNYRKRLKALGVRRMKDDK